MPRLTKEQWEEVKALWEVDCKTPQQIAAAFGVSDRAVRMKAQEEGWKKGKTSELVQRKVAIEKEIQETEKKTSELSEVERKHVRKEVTRILDLEGIRTSYYAELYEKGRKLLKTVDNVNDLKTLTSSAKDLAPQKEAVAVNVQQGMAFQGLTPKEAMDQLRERMRAEKEAVYEA